MQSVFTQHGCQYQPQYQALETVHRSTLGLHPASPFGTGYHSTVQQDGALKHMLTCYSCSRGHGLAKHLTGGKEGDLPQGFLLGHKGILELAGEERKQVTNSFQC